MEEHRLEEGLEPKAGKDEDLNRMSQDSVLSPEHLIHSSDPNVVLTNPVVLNHLRKLHNRATQRGHRQSIDDDINERRTQLRAKVDHFNRRSEVGAFRVKLLSTIDDITYSGPVRFHYRSPDTKRDSFRLMTLSDSDQVRNVLPALRNKFNIPESIKCSLREMINGDEILLDPEDKPLELAVNSKSPVTFHLIAGSDRNTELLQNLKSDGFSPDERKKLIKKFNLGINDAGDDDETKSSITSSPSTPRRRTSLSGSSTSGSLRKFSTNRRRPASPIIVKDIAKINGYGDVSRRSSQRQHTPVKSRIPATSVNTNVRKSKNMSLPAPAVGDVKQTAATRSGRMRSLKHKKGDALATPKRESRSSSARRLFLSLRKYRPRSSSRERKGSKSASDLSSMRQKTADDSKKNAELSSDVNLPGIMKIFGDAISPGANYKSVMATRESSARELVKTAVERYGIPRQQAKLYALCEVVGKVTDNKSMAPHSGLRITASKKKNTKGNSSSIETSFGVGEHGFQEDYIRPLNDHERPLILQSYWKPIDGHCRRFEIRRKSKVFKKQTKDNETRDINLQAKRLVMQKSKPNLSLSAFYVHSSNQPQTDSEDSDDEKASSKLEFDKRRKRNSLDATTSKLDSSVENVAHADASHDTVSQNVPDAPSTTDVKVTETWEIRDSVTPPVPHLLTLQGADENVRDGDLVRYLDREEILVGSDVSDFKLHAPGVLPHHCVIKRHLETFFDEMQNYKASRRWRVVVSPLSSRAELLVNGVRVTSKHALRHGEVLTIGKNIMYMYKDPTSSVNLGSVLSLSFGKSEDNEIKISSDPIVNEQNNDANNDISRSSTPVFAQTRHIIETELSYEVENEDQILDEMFDLFSTNDFDHSKSALVPSTLLCHVITHACLNFDQTSKNELLLKVASNLQTMVLNATRNVSIQEIQTHSPPQHLLPSLRPVFFWMSNSLEIFEFLQKDLIPHIHDRVDEEKERNVVDPKIIEDAEAFEINEEILGLLEEVVMYAFQQLVYYLTKTLYGSLPAILDCNPFSDAESPLSVDHVIELYSSAREMTEQYCVNQQIGDQLFAYLFFFTNVSLFNTLMEEESSTKYFRWEMGARIRGNLEELESWATVSGYSYQSSTFLGKISTLANLLATPRTQIIKSTWSAFRKNFPALNPAQLSHVLTYYQLNGQQRKPKAWQTDPDEEKEAAEKQSVMESYESHPPLVLPVTGSRVKLGEIPDDPKIEALLSSIRDKSTKAATFTCAPSFTGIHPNDGRQQSPVSFEDSASTPDSSTVVRPHYPDFLPESESRGNVASSSGEGRMVSSSSCSSSSEPEAYIDKPRKHDVTNTTNPSKAINILVNHLSDHSEADEREKDCDDLLVLQVSETESLSSYVSSSKNHGISRTPSNGSTGSGYGMPKEVFIVDIKKGKKGLGVGLVDGTITSLGMPGIFVRSLVPDGPSSKHMHSKHHDIITCWLQEGRLQLGDRILAANGVSLINMSYHEAMRRVRQAGDNVRLLVGRCGAEIAMKITSSSC